MKYLRKFATEAEIADVVLPNVVLVEDGQKVLYNYLIGVFIQHIDGSLYSPEDWTKNGFANDKANGVAVCSNEADFVVAKTQFQSEWSSVTNTIIEGASLSNYYSASKDFAGKSNTEFIALTDTSGAAYSCANFKFPNGVSGYFPAYGELLIAARNASKIDEALSIIGGDAMVASAYWSSSQRDATYAFSLTWPRIPSAASANAKAVTLYVRPFASLII
jgi:hypothetical protein